MALLIHSEQQNPNLPITHFHNPESLTLIPFLRQRFSEGPACRILYFLDGPTLLNLRLVSKMTDDEHNLIKELIGRKICFVVDGSEECNAGMITSYLNFRWQSLVFPETLNAGDAYLALQSAHLLVTKHKAFVQDLTISTVNVYLSPQTRRIIEPIFKQLDSLQVSLSTSDYNSLSMVLPYCESLRKLDLKGYTGINFMILGLSQERLEKIFHKVEVLNLSETGITAVVLCRLLVSCAPLISLNLHKCTSISNAMNQMTDEQVKQVFGQIEDLDLGETLIKAEALLRIAGSKPPLRALSLYECRNVPGFYGIEEIFTNMKSLNLGHTGIGSRALISILASCQHLEQLFLTGCENVSKAIEGFAQKDNLPQVVQGLEALGLPNTNINEKAMSSLLLPCRSLHYLDVFACKSFPAVLANMTDEQIQSIFQHVWYLDVGDMPVFPAKDFERLLTRLTSLQILNLDGAKWITGFIEALDDETLGRFFVDLKGIDLSLSDISKKALSKLLHACKALKAFKFLGPSSFSDLIADLDEESIHALLGPIPTIGVRKQDLSQESYEKLLKVLPELEEKLW